MPTLQALSGEERLNILPEVFSTHYCIAGSCLYIRAQPMLPFKGLPATLRYLFINPTQGPNLVHLHRKMKTNSERDQIRPMIADSFGKTRSYNLNSGFPWCTVNRLNRLS